MPKLMVFAPCLQALINAENQTLSLINIMAGLTFQMAEPPPPAGGQYAPITWSVGIQWMRQDDEPSEWYEQHLALFAPGGELTHEAFQRFIIGLLPQRIISHFVGFPVFEAGTYLLKLRLRKTSKDGAETEPWAEVADYPIQLVINLPPQQPE